MALPVQDQTLQEIRPAQEWLSRTAGGGKSAARSESFETFMSSRGITVSAEQREALFREFLTWQNDRQNDRQKAARRVTRQD